MENNDFLEKAIEGLKKTGAQATIPQEVVDKTLNRLLVLENERKRLPVKAGWPRVLGLAAAAVVLVAAGLFAGRLTKPSKLDTEQIAALEKTIKTSLQAQLQQDLQKNFEQTFADFVTANNEQLTSLASSIDDTQQWQQLVIAAVLEQMELNRQNENEELANALVTFASQTEEKLNKTDAILVKLIGNNNPQKNQENQKNNLQ